MVLHESSAKDVRTRAQVLCCFIACLFVFPDAHAADFLVVGRGEHLLVYNKYQQQATAQERQVLTPLVPMKVLNADGVLSDGFTRCMQVEVRGQVLFLLKDKEGKLVHSAPLGVEQMFRNATLITDTVEVLRGKSLRIVPLSSSPQYLPAGGKIARIFRHQKGTYCGTLDSPPVFGFVDFAKAREGKDWRVVRKTVAALDSIPAGVLRNVESRIAAVNDLLARLFAHFNKETHEQREAPRWRLVSSATAISCTLLTTSPAEHFQQSTQYLVKDLENIALGANLEVTHAPQKIDMRLR